MTVSSMSAIDTDKQLMGAPNNCRVTGKVDFSGTNMVSKNKNTCFYKKLIVNIVYMRSLMLSIVIFGFALK